MRLRALALLFSVLLVASCGSETSDDGGHGDLTEFSDENLGDLLLTDADLPSGFALDELVLGPNDDDDDDDDTFEVQSGNPACGEFFAEDDLLQLEPAAQASAEFIRADFAPIFGHSIASYDTTSGLADAFDLVDQLLDTCAGEELTMGDDDFTMRLTFDEGSFPDLGDRSASLQLEGQMLEFQVDVRIVFLVVQRENTVSGFTGMSFFGENITDEEITQLAQTALERLDGEL